MDAKDNAMTRCRSCLRGVGGLIPIFSLGNLYVSNFANSASSVYAADQIPLDLVLCDTKAGGCGLVQLRHTVPSALLYQNYWYRSGTNASMRRALSEITLEAERLARPSSGDIVLDIGCNDGTLLRSYRTAGLIRVGFEPASNLVPEARLGSDQIIGAYFNLRDFDAFFPGRKAKIITSIAMFYDLDDPNQFTAGVAQCLDTTGVWFIQMSYLPLMLEQNAFDNICHEHLEYYSLSSLKHLLHTHGLQIVDVQLNDVNGGSFRVAVCHQGQKGFSSGFRQARVEAQEAFEEVLKLSEPAIYQEFAERVHQIKDLLRSFVRKEVDRGAKIYVYGASTKGNTLLQFLELDSKWIKAAADRNPDKWGKKTIGTWIPIVSEDEARADEPDYFLVLPWHFLGEFAQREEAYLKRGGKFIIPLPYPEIMTEKGRMPL